MEKLTILHKPDRNRDNFFRFGDRLTVTKLNFFSEEKEVTFTGLTKDGMILTRLSFKGEAQVTKKALKDKPHYTHISYSPPSMQVNIRIPASSLLGFQFLGERNGKELYRITDAEGQIFILAQEVGKKPANFFLPDGESPPENRPVENNPVYTITLGQPNQIAQWRHETAAINRAQQALLAQQYGRGNMEHIREAAITRYREHARQRGPIDEIPLDQYETYFNPDTNTIVRRTP